LADLLAWACAICSGRQEEHQRQVRTHMSRHTSSWCCITMMGCAYTNCEAAKGVLLTSLGSNINSNSNNVSPPTSALEGAVACRSAHVSHDL